MVEKEPAETADRPQGLLNRRYRRYLLGESDIEPRTQAERDIRMNIRQRLYNGLLDFTLIYQHVEQRDIDMALTNLEGDDRLNRDEAIAYAIALFIGLGSGEELADVREFERYVERAAILSWYDRYDAVGGDVWLGEPTANLTVEFPDRVDLGDLVEKTASIWRRIHETDGVGRDDVEDSPPGQELAERLGLNSLSADEVLYLLSNTTILGESRKSDDSGGERGVGVKEMEEVAELWVLWKQQTRRNIPDTALEVFTEKRRLEESAPSDYLNSGPENGEGE